MRLRSWVLWAAVLSSSIASAQLYSQLPSPGDEGGAYSDANQTIADNFTTATSAAVSHITFWGSFDGQGDPFPSGGSRTVSASFFNDDGAGLPGSLILQETLVATFAPSGLFTSQQDTIYQFDTDWIGPTFFTPTSGTQYWLSVFDTEGVNSFRWHNGLTGDDHSGFTTNGGASWNSDGGRPNYAFVLNPVPEPASMAALGLGAIALLRRRKRA